MILLDNVLEDLGFYGDSDMPEFPSLDVIAPEFAELNI